MPPSSHTPSIPLNLVSSQLLEIKAEIFRNFGGVLKIQATRQGPKGLLPPLAATKERKRAKLAERTALGFVGGGSEASVCWGVVRSEATIAVGVAVDLDLA